MIFRKKAFGAFFSILGLVIASPGLSADRDAYPTFLLDVNYGLTTMKSKLVESNDTGSSLAYSLGGFAGDDKQIEYRIGFETDAATFALNDSKIVYEWQDTRLNYHMGMFYAGLVFSRLTMEASRAGTDIIDAAGSGYGGSLGFLTEIGKRGMFRLDVTQVSLPQLKNALVSEVAVSSRLDVDLSASFDLYGKWSFFNIGYRMRNTGIKADVNAAETESATYVGLRFMTLR